MGNQEEGNVGKLTGESCICLSLQLLCLSGVFFRHDFVLVQSILDRELSEVFLSDWVKKGRKRGKHKDVSDDPF